MPFVGCLQLTLKLPIFCFQENVVCLLCLLHIFKCTSEVQTRFIRGNKHYEHFVMSDLVQLLAIWTTIPHMQMREQMTIVMIGEKNAK